MIVTMDGQRVDGELAPGMALRDVIDRARTELIPGRLVVSVAVNGVRLAEDELEIHLAQAVTEGDQIDLESGDPQTLAAEALRGVADEIAAAGRRAPQIADQLDRGESAEGVRQISELVQAWQMCNTAIVQCSGLVGCDLTQGQLDGQSMREGLTELVAKLRELRDALEARDLVLLADLLHYEVPAVCETWHGVLIALAAQVQAHTAVVV
jgi:hypothetical protein